MSRNHLLACFLIAGLLAGGAAAAGGPKGSTKEPKPDRASAYFHYSLGHLYAELSGAYGHRGEFVDKAIENFRKAMEADPGAAFLSEELAELYFHSGRLRDAVEDAEEALKKNPNNVAARRILARIYTRLIGDTRTQRVSQEMLDKSIEQYEKITELQPDDVQAWLMLGRLHKINHDSLSAEAAYKKVLELDPENQDALIQLGLVYSDLGDRPRAVETFRKAAEKGPSARALTYLAGTYEQMNRYDLAAEAYGKALELAPDNPELKRAYAASLLRAGKIEESRKVFEELAAADPKDYEAHLRLSQIYRQRGKLQKAREALDAARKAAPGNLEVLYTNVGLLEAEGKVEEAIEALKEILDSTQRVTYSKGEKSNRAIFLERLGLMYRLAGRYDEAVKTFRELEELDPDTAPRMAAQITDTYRQAKQFDKAFEVITAARKKYPDDELVGVLYATVLADLGRADEAVRAVRKLTKGKNDRDSLLTQAQIYEKVKRYDLMAGVLDKALELSKTDEEKAAVLFMRGAMYERQKRVEEAEAAFREVLRLTPDNASAMNYLGYMFADLNIKLDEAHKLISKALEYEPNNGAFLDSMGWVYYRMNRLEEAEKYLQQAVEKVGGDPIVHDHLGDVYFKRGKLREAVAQWKLSLKEWEKSSASDRDPKQVAKVQKKLERAEIRLAKEALQAKPKQP